jgi:hypothetical protein
MLVYCYNPLPAEQATSAYVVDSARLWSLRQRLQHDDNVGGNRRCETFGEIKVLRVRRAATDSFGKAAVPKRAGAFGSAKAKFAQHCDNGFGLHPFAKFEVDLPSLHQSIVPDDELGGHRQERGLIPLIFFELHANLFV